jgi:hypothetical protein
MSRGIAGGVERSWKTSLGARRIASRVRVDPFA